MDFVLFSDIDLINPDAKDMVNKNTAMSREMKAIGGIHVLDQKKGSTEAAGSSAAVAEVPLKKPTVAVSDDVPDGEEIL